MSELTSQEAASAAVRPVLSGLYKVVAVGENRVEIGHAGRVIVLSGTRVETEVKQLLAALDGSRTRAELVDAFPDMGPRLLEALEQRALLIDAGSPGGSAGLKTAAAVDVRSAAQVAQRLSCAVVLIVGLGPVGATTAILLARAGVGTLLLSDVGIASPSDVALTAELAPESIGQPRDAAIGCRCRKHGVLARSVAPAQVPGAFASASLSIVAGDNLHMSANLPMADRVHAVGGSYLVHSQDGHEALVGPLVSSNRQPCHRCLRERRRSHVGQSSVHQAMPAAAVDGNEPDSYLAAHVAVVAGLVAAEAVRFLAGAPPVTEGAVLISAFDRLEVWREPLLANPWCPICREE